MSGTKINWIAYGGVFFLWLNVMYKETFQDFSGNICNVLFWWRLFLGLFGISGIGFTLFSTYVWDVSLLSTYFGCFILAFSESKMSSYLFDVLHFCYIVVHFLISLSENQWIFISTLLGRLIFWVLSVLVCQYIALYACLVYSHYSLTVHVFIVGIMSIMPLPICCFWSIGILLLLRGFCYLWF